MLIQISILIEFAQAINQSKIVLSCASKFNYRLGKYVEVPACASVLATDVPYDEQDKYDHMIQISNSMTDDEIIKILEDYLQNDEKKYNNLVQKVLNSVVNILRNIMQKESIY